MPWLKAPWHTAPVAAVPYEGTWSNGLILGLPRVVVDIDKPHEGPCAIPHGPAVNPFWVVLMGCDLLPSTRRGIYPQMRGLVFAD